MDLQDILNPAPPAALPVAPPRFRGHVSSPPPPGSPLAYDEDTLVTLILSIFTLLARIGHLGALDLIYPRDPRHNIDEALCAELNLDARVISLLKRLPYFAQPGYSESIMIAPGSFLPNYLDPEHLRQGRQMYALPGFADPEADWPGLRPQDVVLLYNIEFDQLSDTWILDTEASMLFFQLSVVLLYHDWPSHILNAALIWSQDTIRRFTSSSNFVKAKDVFPNYLPPFQEQDGRDGRPRNYRNEVALHAPTVLMDYIDDLRRLIYVPTHQLDYSEITFAYDSYKVYQVRQKLVQEYGWPGEGEEGQGFREQDWKRDKDRVWKEAAQLGAEHPDWEPVANAYRPEWR